jgi:transposase-like protein
MLKYSKISKYKIEKVMECFCLDLDATKTAILTRLNRNTINRYFRIFRDRIVSHQLTQLQRFVGVIEVDESYFGPGRPRGRPGPRKRGRGTLRQPVFGIFERDGSVYTEIVSDCSAASLLPIIRGRVDPSSIVHTDGWRGYDGLVAVGYDKHVRINKNQSFAVGKAHINGIEAFWSFVKRRLAKFNGIRKDFFLTHLKECEWRYGKPFQVLRAHLRSLMKDV